MIDIGLDLQRAYDDGYQQGIKDEHEWWVTKAIEMTLERCRFIYNSCENGCKNCKINCMWREV